MVVFFVIVLAGFVYFLIDKVMKKRVKNVAGRVVVNLALLSVVSFILFVAAVIVYFVYSLRYKPEDFDFNQQQMAFINAYKVNDTLCFTNEKGIIDTYIVAEIKHDQRTQPGVFMASPAFNSQEVKLVQCHGDDSQSNFLIETMPQDKVRLFNINYKNFSYRTKGNLGELHTDTVKINDKKLTNYYLFRNSYPAAVNPSDIIVVYWHIKEGIVAYETLDNGYWVKSTIQ